MTFNLKTFTKKLHEDFKGKLSFEEVEELLDLNEKYNKDTPLSTGKKLVITKITFQGVKNSEGKEYNGDIINYSTPVYPGINVWIADNFKGKSSIFKIIKFALTGRDSLKPNIRKWLKSIILNFQVSEKEFTIYLNLERRLQAMLLNGSYDNPDAIFNNKENVLLQANSEAQYQQVIQDFFFNQFSYYSLKWTQKHSSKDRNELVEAEASWATYFRSILLESKDSGEIYGAQGKKIIEMLLGLEYTYPINRLKVKKDLLLDEKAKDTLFQGQKEKQWKERLENLSNKKTDLENSITSITDIDEPKINLSSLYDEYNALIKEISEANSKLVTTEQDVKNSSRQINNLRQKQQNIGDEKDRILLEINKTKRNISDLNEYLEIGIFFSNLDIKECPSCSHVITDNKKRGKIENHRCYVCDDPIVKSDSDEKAVYSEKIANLETILKELQAESESLQSEINDLEQEKQFQYTHLESLNYKRQLVENTSSASKRLREVEEEINLQKAVSTIIRPDREKLIIDKAIVEFQIAQLKEEEITQKDSSKIDSKIELLTQAILHLNELRYSTSETVLNRFAELMLLEIQDFGLKSISEIKITDKFDILYNQDGEFISFDNIAEGEQLRAKIALYLSLIQLDIEFNFGRHTRFLIIDSPGKEEADSNYLTGLANLLISIEKRFGQQLQILIGTAERDLENVVQHQNITPANEFVF